MTQRPEIIYERRYYMDNIINNKSYKRAGYAYVPPQKLDKVYSPNKALKAGTVFPELDLTIDEYERGLYNGK